MKMMKRVLPLLLLITLYSTAGFAQAAKSEDPHTIPQVMDHSIGNVESEFISAADAMPEDKYSFAPATGEFKGVRTFAEQIKHVAAVNYILGAAVLGEKSPVDATEENGPAALKSKAEILKFLKDSFAYAHKALNSINDKNLIEPMKNPFGEGSSTRLGLAFIIVGHPFDHYGQIVEYLRMNNIVPPASRPAK